jgi:multidrug efflux pump subunit AcrB
VTAQADAQCRLQPEDIRQLKTRNAAGGMVPLGSVATVRETSGAGAEMRQALGPAVFFGMLGVTLFGLFLTPVFYVVIMWFQERATELPVAPEPPAAKDEPEPPAPAPQTAG